MAGWRGLVNDRGRRGQLPFRGSGEIGSLAFLAVRSVRNELEPARLRHAHRLATDLHRSWTRDDLMRLEPEDILADLPAGVPLPSPPA